MSNSLSTLRNNLKKESEYKSTSDYFLSVLCMGMITLSFCIEGIIYFSGGIILGISYFFTCTGLDSANEKLLELFSDQFPHIYEIEPQSFYLHLIVGIVSIAVSIVSGICTKKIYYNWFTNLTLLYCIIAMSIFIFALLLISKDVLLCILVIFYIYCMFRNFLVLKHNLTTKERNNELL